MDRVFIYWDNSNIFHEAQRLAEERSEGPNARYRIRVHFDNMLRLAHADRPIERALAVGSVPPEMRQLWNRMESNGIEVRLFDRGSRERGEQEIPDRLLQLRMLEDALDYSEDPGIAVLLTDDGAGYLEGAGFHSTLERMHRRNWHIEILSWVHACNQRMRRWAENNGVFVPLDDFYDAITFMEPSTSPSSVQRYRDMFDDIDGTPCIVAPTEPSRPGFEFAQARDANPIDLSRRLMTP